MMAGQVKHAKIFSSIRPDWKLVKVMASLVYKNTDSLIGGVTRVLADEGINLVDSTLLLKPLLAPVGVITKRKPECGGKSGYRIRAQNPSPTHWRASISVRASRSANAPAWRWKPWKVRTRCCVWCGQPCGGEEIDAGEIVLYGAGICYSNVPVIGPMTIDVMIETNTTALAVDAGRTLLLDRDELLQKANAAKIAIAALEPGEAVKK